MGRMPVATVVAVVMLSHAGAIAAERGVTLASGPAQEGAAIAAGTVLREIVDPATGKRWLLERPRPGAPGRLVLAGDVSATTPRSGAEIRGMPVIHAGDPVVVTANTTVMDAELEGRALTSACAGAALRVRLKIGGRVVRGIALGPGRAQWLPGSGREARP